MDTKKWYQSWTIWFNIAIGVLAAVNDVVKVLPISAATVIEVQSVVNVLLRWFKTAQEIEK